MRTHTIRTLKGGRKSIRFQKFFFDKLKSSDWWSAGIVIFHLKKSLLDLTGREHVLDSLQQEDLDRHFGLPKAPGFDYCEHMIERFLVDGISCGSMVDLDDLLSVLGTFAAKFFGDKVRKS